MKKKFAILGGGIAGLSAAIALKNIGIDAVVFEAASSIKPAGAGLVLAANAMKAVKELGIENEVIASGKCIDTFTMYTSKGKIIRKTDSVAVSKKFGLDNFSIHRAQLHELLISRINPTDVRLNKKIKSFAQDAKAVTIYFEDATVYQADYVIAAEGIHSAVRKKLLPQSTARYAGYTCWRGVVQNTSLQINESSETMGSKGRFGIVPLSKNSVYWFACINTSANNPVMKQYRIEDLLHHFKDYHSVITALLNEAKNEHLIWGDILDLEPLPQYAFNQILLIGDAAHATTPNLGQGACQAIEDAVVLAREIRDNLSIENAFRNFEQRRLKRTHWIVNTSRHVGRLAQSENPIVIQLRNLLFRFIPKSITDRQFEKLYSVDFDSKA